MKKLLAALIAGSFAAGAFAQAATPAQPATPAAAAAAPTVKHMKAKPAKSIICSTAPKRCTSPPDRPLKAAGGIEAHGLDRRI
nr:hypothetical protein [Comamonas testosteroni]